MGWLSAVISAAGSFLSSKADAKDKQRAARAANADEYLYSARLSRYDKALEDYYTQRDKQETRNAASEFSKFSTLDKWAPGYTQTYKPIQGPNAPPTSANVADMSYYKGYTNSSQPSTPTALNTSSNNSATNNIGSLDDLAAYLRNNGGG